MDYRKLQTEAGKVEYNAMDDDQIAVALNASFDVYDAIDPDDLLVYLHEKNLAGVIRGRVNGPNPGDEVLTNFMARADIKRPINVRHPVFQAGLDILISDKTLTATQRIEIEQLNTRSTSIAQELGLGTVNGHQVETALAGRG